LRHSFPAIQITFDNHASHRWHTEAVGSSTHLGTPDQELTLLVGLHALNVAMFASCFLLLWGLRGEGPTSARLPLALLRP
jgi:hypothetical protein